MESDNSTRNIVKVRFTDDEAEGIGREYSYYAEDRLALGEFVSAPTRSGNRPARVTAVDVPESSIAAFKDRVKTIPSKHKPRNVSVSSSIDVGTKTVGEALKETPSEFAAGFQEVQAKPPATLPEAVKQSAAADGVTVTEVEIETELFGDVGRAVIQVSPQLDAAVMELQTEVLRLLQYAKDRQVAGDEDVKNATDDLSIMAQLAKNLETYRKKYVDPINGHLKQINGVFKLISEPLAEAQAATKTKVLKYQADVRKKREELEQLNREAEDLARRQAAASGTGEFTVNTTPVPVPPPPPAHVRTDVGTLGNTTVWKWKLLDITQVPKEYLMVNEPLVTKVVKSGLRSIAGIEIYSEAGLRVTPKGGA